MIPDESPELTFALARHDLRTPVNAVVGYAEMLAEDDDGSLPPVVRDGLTELAALGRTVADRIATLRPSDEVEGGVWIAARAALGPLAGRLSTWAEAVAIAGAELSIAGDLARVRTAAKSLVEMIANAGPLDRPAQPLSAYDPTPLPIPAAIPPGHLLIVDDDAANRHLLAREVQKQGHTFALAGDGTEALAMLAAAPFDLVLLDLMLPGISGIEVLARVRRDPVLGHTPIIVVSARDDTDELVRCLEAGAEDFLPKPCNPAVLKARVGSCLEKKRLRDWELEYMRHVNAITAAAAGIEYGEFDPESLAGVAARPDALGGLARVFARTAAGVIAREEQLRKQVLELRVEIDQTRRDRQVEEIADSDFMQALIARADELRGRPAGD